MIVMKANKTILRVMGLIPGARLSSFLPFFWCFWLIAMVLPLIAYSIENISDVRKATDATYVIAADFLCGGQYLFLVAQKSAIVEIMQVLEQLIAARKERPYYVFYKHTEQRIRLYTKSIQIFVIISSSACLFLPFFVAAFCYLYGTYTPSVWFLPYKVIMPWDDNTVLGYSLTMTNVLIGSWTTCLIIATVDSLFFGICFYIETMLAEMFSMFTELDEYLEKHEVNHRDVYVARQLQEIIRFHATIINFANKFEELMSGVVFVTFGSSVLWICTSLFQIQANIEQRSIFVLQSIITTMAVVLIIFIFCFFGNNVTTKFSDAAERIYASYWYKYPIQLQPIVIVLLARAQDDFYFRGFKWAHCSLNSFSTLMYKSSQFFMVFRSIEK